MQHIYFQTRDSRNINTAKSIKLLLLLLFLPLCSFAQLSPDWSRTYKQGAATADMVIGTDGHPVILSTGINLVGSLSSRLTKLDAMGDPLWVNDLNDESFTFEMDNSGNSYALGDIVSKFSQSGQLLWEFDLMQLGLQAEDIKADNAGNIYIAGMSSAIEAAVLKLNSSGNLVWLKQMPFRKASTTATALSLVIGDAVYLGGTEPDDAGIDHMTLIKLNTSSGEILFHETYAESNEADGHYRLGKLLWSGNGNVYLVGENMSTVVGQTNLVIIKVTTGGKVVWEEAALFEHRSYFADAALDAAGNILLLSLAQFLSGPTGIVTAKYSSSGENMWQNTFSTGNEHNANPSALATSPDGYVAVTGSTVDENENSALLVLLYNRDGSQAGSDLYHATPSSEDRGINLGFDTRENFFVAGSTYPDAQSEYNELLVLKYNLQTNCEAPAVTATGGTLSCEDGSLQLTGSSSSTNMSYSWTGPEGFASNEQNPTVTIAGDYTLTVTDPATGCSASATVAVKPQGTVTEPIVVCHMMDLGYDEYKKGLISTLHTKAGPVSVMGRKRNPDGTYAPQNHAAIFDSQAPTGDDSDLYTTDWGHVLIINQDQTNVPNDNQYGGEMILDFSAIGTVTMESLRALDIDNYEGMSWVYLYDGEGNELYKVELQNLGDNSKQTVNLGNTEGVMKMKVVLDGRNESSGLAGSGAIDDIRFCIEEEGEGHACVDAQQGTDNVNISETTSYPNPFNDVAVLKFKLRNSESYVVNLYNLRGELIRQLKSGTAVAGALNTVEVDGRSLMEGMYLIRVVSGSDSETIKVILKR